MNFFTDKPGAGINSIGVHITVEYVVLIVDGVNQLYPVGKWEEAIDFLKHSLKDSKVEYIEKYIVDNLDHLGAKYKTRPKQIKENDQLSLF